jgi:5-methylcytosine-specific restriction endonuclease McrA
MQMVWQRILRRRIWRTASPTPSGAASGDLESSTGEKEPKLTVELVPKTVWGANLSQRLPRKEWDRLRHIAYDQADDRCEVCGGTGTNGRLECHEVWDYDDENRIQRLVRLCALCPACHQVKHIGRARAYGREDEARAHLAETNGWTGTQALRYVEEQGALWLQRSHHQWTLNLDALVQYGPALSPSSRRRRCEGCGELFSPDRLAVHDGERLCEDCEDDWGYEMWPDHELPPPGMSDPDN